MSYSFGKRALKIGVIALGLTSLSCAAVVMSADAAFAEKGGNGNGNGRGNANRNDRSNNSDRNGNGRGAIASELRGLNAANANQRALENASPNSMPGKLYVYQQARTEFAQAVNDQNAAYDEYGRLIGLTEDEVAANFPDGGYEDAVMDAATKYEELRNAALASQAANDESLAILTEGRELSIDALAELNRLLGL